MTGSGRRPGSRRPCSPTAQSPRGRSTGDLYLRGSGDPSFGDDGAQPARASGSRDTGLEQVDGRVYGDETFFDRRRGGPASGFGDLALRRAAVRAGLQPRLPAAVRARLAEQPAAASPPSACGSRCGARRSTSTRRGRAPAARRRTRPRSRPSSSPPLAKHRAAHEPGVGQLLRRDAAEGPRRPVRRRRLDRGRRAGRARVRARGSASAPGSWTAPASHAATSSRRATSAACCSSAQRRAVVRLLLPLAAAGGQDRHARTSACAARPPSGRCRAKTGTLSGVSALAGYCRARRGPRSRSRC